MILGLLGLVQTWNDRFQVGSDGLSYIDMAEMLWRGEWSQAINSIWSPGYPLILGLPLKFLSPSPYWEIIVVQTTNLVIFVFAICSFEFFLRKLYTYARDTALPNGQCLPEWCLIIIGYIVFAWSSLTLIKVTRVMPDMLVSAVIYLATGLLLSIRRESRSPIFCAGFGLLLAVGYWIKTILFPLGFVFIAIGTCLLPGWRIAVSRGAVMLSVFLLVSAPLVAWLSWSTGQITFGNSGRYIYARTVNSIAIPVHWQGWPPESGTPRHPTRKLFDSPAVYEFGDPVPGTYPPWQDPFYWFDGITPHFDMSGQIRVAAKSLETLWAVLENLNGGLVAAVAVLMLMSVTLKSLLSEFWKLWFVWLSPLIALTIFCLVFIEARYIAPHLTILFVSATASIRLARSEFLIRLAGVVSLVIIIFWLCSFKSEEFVSKTSVVGAVRKMIFQPSQESEHVHWEIAKALKAVGVNKGDHVAYVGESYRFYWARLAGVKVTAEVRQFGTTSSPTKFARKEILRVYDNPNWRHADAFWSKERKVREDVLALFRQTGIQAVVSDYPVPVGAANEGWLPVGVTGYHILSFAGRQNQSVQKGT